MKKRGTVVLAVLIFSLFAALTLCACGPNLKGVSFADTVFAYDGSAHSIEIEGTLPEGVTIEYENNTRTAVGSQTAKAIFKDDKGKVIETKEAKLTIEASLASIAFEDASFPWDGRAHSLAVKSETLPEGVTVAYENNTLTEIGSVTVTATFRDGDGTMIGTKTATLSVVKASYDMSGVRFEDKTFFYDGSTHELTVTGELPEGVSVRYLNNAQSALGTYEATAVFTAADPAHYEIPRRMKAHFIVRYAETFTLTFDPGLGSMSESRTMQVTEGQRYTYPTPERNGYEFAGWLDDEESVYIRDGEWKFRYDVAAVAAWTKATSPVEAGVLRARVEENEITLDLNTVGEAGIATVVRMQPNEYYLTDPRKGLSDDVTEGTELGTYYLGTKDALTFARYGAVESNIVALQASNYDYLYSKYYVVRDGKIVKGPIYAADIASKYTYSEPFAARSIKGLSTEDVGIAEDLGISWTSMNFTVNDVFYSREIPYKADPSQADNPALYDWSDEYTNENAIEFEFNGNVYKFRKDKIAYYDSVIKDMTDKKIKTTLVLLMTRQSGGSSDACPWYMTYYDTYDFSSSTLSAVNTSNTLGMQNWAALMEFLASRYSDPNGTHGYVDSFVLGNEIDAPPEWNPIVNYDKTEYVPLDTYMEEYYRQLRIADLAIKKYYGGMKALVPTTHFWNKNSKEMQHRDYNCYYRPKEIYDWINDRSKEQGDFDWGISSHAYGLILEEPNVLQSDTTPNNRNDDRMTGSLETTGAITITNLELIDQYLHQERLKCNGKTRDVYMLEVGVSSYNNSAANLAWQCRGVAYAYYKAANLDTIKAFVYYREKDHPTEGSIKVGLLDYGSAEKPAYRVWKYIDTQYSEQVTASFLREYRWYNEDLTLTGLGANGTWRDLMEIYDTGYDWSGWSMDRIAVRHVDTAP